MPRPRENPVDNINVNIGKDLAKYIRSKAKGAESYDRTLRRLLNVR